ncbi:efflux RND transporter periplasmic adaptor subunit [Neptunomonas sp. XY-337]|uniref:efflux RND transporter periplasmic adaptor subunit n=1 Tax=Neptunomonas sp. XY-337 TaxID=2561897 RepID=UPI0010AABF3F|nr:efflux RND transporter periplasmic adaptor subunit [Neptunomonas sp. XY-337]
MSGIIKNLLVMTAGAALGIGGVILFVPAVLQSQPSTESAEKQPLYWVAPMDANYRRDQPGKSPMGMDLVPVYEEASDSTVVGAVEIAPQVVNNLGVKTAAVIEAPFESRVATVGYVQYSEDALVHIHPRIEGWVEALFVESTGSPVEQGAPLYRLYSPQLVTAQQELLIALKRGNRILAKAARSRLAALHVPSHFIKELERTREVQQSVTFYAPQSGMIENLSVREGFYVKPDTTLMSIAKLDEVWVEGEVFANQAALVTQGQPVQMSLDYFPGQQWQGNVEYIYPTLSADTRTLRLRMRFANPDQRLRPNMFASLTLFARDSETTLMVPREAVIRTGRQDRVVVALEEGQFKSVAVQLGRMNDRYIEVLDGVLQTDRIVTSAQFLLDSESSKSSDFLRMAPAPSKVWMAGEVNAVTPAERLVNISHEPAPEWKWPAMTMNFVASDQVDINQLEKGQTLHFEVAKGEAGDYQITGIHIMSQPRVSSATVNGTINRIDIENRVINISRDAIEKWDRPAVTMDFIASEDVDLAALTVGAVVRFTFEVRDDLVITELAPAPTHANHSDTQQH